MARIVIDGVSKTFPDGTHAVRELDLDIGDGELMVLVGPSGCGKTTLLRAMLGLLPVTEGEILIGGISLARLGTAYYRGLIGTVMQDDKLFSGSMADNITFFDSSPDMARVEEAVKQLELTRVIVAHRPETIASADRVIHLAGPTPQTNVAPDLPRVSGRSR